MYKYKRDKRYLRKIVNRCSLVEIKDYKLLCLSDYMAGKEIGEIITRLKSINVLHAIHFFEKKLEKRFDPQFVDIC